MTVIRTIAASAGIATLLSLSACDTMNPQQGTATQSTYPAANSQNAQYGIVESMQMVQQQGTSGVGGVGVGTIVGAVVGGVLGNQVGKGTGNTAATVLGAAGGAYAGHQVEKNTQGQRPADAVQMVVRLNDGTRVTVTQDAAGDVRVGDRVVIVNGAARRY